MQSFCTVKKPGVLFDGWMDHILGRPIFLFLSHKGERCGSYAACYNACMSIWIVIVLILVITALVVLLVNQHRNQTIQITQVKIELDHLPEAFDGFRIVQISDLHGNELQGLVEKTAAFKPDLIACTGDLYDGVRYADRTEKVLEDLADLAPVYFVTGNHEYYSGKWSERAKRLPLVGVQYLNNRCTLLTREGQSIELCGIDDPDLNYRWSYAKRLEQFQENLNQLAFKGEVDPDEAAKQSEPPVRILLSHRADLFEQSGSAKADLVLSGHLHGGQWRLLNNGVIAPYNGDRFVFFPKYDAGLYRYGQSQMYVSRGLGDQMRIPRLFNPPELVWITLKRPSKPALDSNQSSK